MKVVVLMLSLLCIFSVQAAGVYKCQGENGQITYQGIPCVDQVTLQKPEANSRDHKNTFQSRRDRISEALDKSVIIDFGDTAYGQLKKSVALLESISVDGRDCEWALKVQQEKIGACEKFLLKMVDGREWSQAGSVLINLTNNNDASFYSEYKMEFSKAKRLMDRIVGYKEFASIMLNK